MWQRKTGVEEGFFIKKTSRRIDFLRDALFDCTDFSVAFARLAAKGKALEQALVELIVRALGIIQKLAAASHHHQQTAAGSMVMLVLGEVLGEVNDALGKHGYLETGGTGILLVDFEVIDVDFAHCRN